jgi:hypothetical protein
MAGESRVRQRLLRGALFHCQTAFPSYDAEGIFMATGKSQKQASGGSALGFEAIARYKVALPPATMAAKFSELIQPLIGRIIANIHESRTPATLRDSLLPKLLSGELRVPVAKFTEAT